MYQALYRKYRPKCFGDVSGQEHITDTLRNQAASGRLSHAYLFVGTRGTGKTSCAKILARAVNCQNPQDGEPCNKCASCIGIENGSILDVLELDAASNNRVDDVRLLLDEAIYTPASVKKRVYIVDEVQMYTTQSFNALLRILEEPYEHLMFILATTELHKVPATILSRCQRFSFKRLSPAAISERLRSVAGKEGLELTEEAAEKLAALADGSMRDGLSLLDQCASDNLVDLQRVLDTVGLAGQQELLRLFGAIADRDAAAALSILDGLYDDGKDMAALLNELAILSRDMLVSRLSADSPLLSGSFSRAEISGLSKKLTPERLFSFLDMIREAILSLSRGGSVRVSVEMCLIRMCDERLSDDPAAVLSRLARLESNPQPVYEAVIAASEPQAHEQDALIEGLRVEPAMTSLVSQQPPLAPATPESSTAPESSDIGFWGEILDLLKDNAPVYALLSDGVMVGAEHREGMLTVRVNNSFTAAQIESKMTSGPLKDAAEKILNREVVIRVETVSGIGEDAKHGKLERLSAFGNVNFE